MRLLTRETDYAVRALRYLAKKRNRIVSAVELVKNLGIPRPFLRKILQGMHKKGIIKSYKGKGGGFCLKKDPQNVYLSDIMEAFQGPLALKQCIFKKKSCHLIDSCHLKNKLDLLEEDLIKNLMSVSLKSIMD